MRACMTALRVIGSLLGATLLGLAMLWAVAAILLGRIEPERLRQALALLFAAGFGWTLLQVRPWPRAVLRIAAASLAVVVAFVFAPASNQGRWQPDVARTSTIDIVGNRIVVHNGRNFRWQTETEFREDWKDREYRLSELSDVDLIMSYWGPREYCHSFVSFGFSNGERLAVSVETRKEISEQYSALAGFFRRYELIYIFSD